MTIAVRQRKRLDLRIPGGQGDPHGRRQHRLKRRVAVPEPSAVEQLEPLPTEHLGAWVEKLVRPVWTVVPTCPATLELRLEFGDRRRLEWRLELLVDDALVALGPAVIRL